MDWAAGLQQEGRGWNICGMPKQESGGVWLEVETASPALEMSCSPL